MKKFLHFFTSLLVLSPTMLLASHFMGGEITWQCLSNGNYRFIMKLYRECNGIYFGNLEQLNVTGYPGLTSVTMNLYPNATAGRTDISPVCNLNHPGDPLYSHISCFPSPPSPNTGAVEEWFYTSDASYPNGVTLNGVPPATGWVFSYSACCRNPCTNIPNANLLDWYLRAIMYPYLAVNEFPCWDNSPVFAERPACVVSTNYPQQYNPDAYDPEGDSLSFAWAQALTALNSPITLYAPGYTYNSPLPGITQNSNNIPATIDSTTGEISFTSFTQGAFVTASKTSAFKRNTLIAEIFREIQIVLLPSSNTPPVVTPPFPQNIADPWVDTVMAGDLVSFTMFAQDLGLQNNNIDPQDVSYTASGALFGAGFTNDSMGCLEPPCATLNPPPPFTNITSVTTIFTWQTSCAHESFGTGNLDNWVDYYFVFSFRDDYCPIPGLSERTVKLVVQDPVLLPPTMDHMSINPGNGDVTLFWIPPADPYGAFHKYLLYFKTSINGPWMFLDSIAGLSQTSYVHVGANGNSQPLWYVMKTLSGCMGNKLSAFSNQLMNPLAQTISASSPATGDRTILVIPDPVTGDLGIAFNNTGAKNLNLIVTDVLGKIVYSTSTVISPGKNTLKFGLNRPKPGVYLYSLCVDQVCKNDKFLIAR